MPYLAFDDAQDGQDKVRFFCYLFDCNIDATELFCDALSFWQVINEFSLKGK